jgi:hypothetical protein
MQRVVGKSELSPGKLRMQYWKGVLLRQGYIKIPAPGYKEKECPKCHRKITLYDGWYKCPKHPDLTAINGPEYGIWIDIPRPTPVVVKNEKELDKLKPKLGMTAILGDDKQKPPALWMWSYNRAENNTKWRKGWASALPVIKKGSKRWNLIMKLARLSPKSFIRYAKNYYGDYPEVIEMLKLYREDTLKTIQIKPPIPFGRVKSIAVLDSLPRGKKKQPPEIKMDKISSYTVGFPAHSRIFIDMLRKQIINSERGLYTLGIKAETVKIAKQGWQAPKKKKKE